MTNTEGADTSESYTVVVDGSRFDGKLLTQLANNPDGTGSIKLEGIAASFGNRVDKTLMTTTKPNTDPRGTDNDVGINKANPRFVELVRGPVPLTANVATSGQITSISADPDTNREEFLRRLSENPLAKALSNAGLKIAGFEEK